MARIHISIWSLWLTGTWWITSGPRFSKSWRHFEPMRLLDCITAKQTTDVGIWNFFHRRFGSRLTGNIKWVGHNMTLRRRSASIGNGTTMRCDQILVTGTTKVDTKLDCCLKSKAEFSITRLSRTKPGPRLGSRAIAARCRKRANVRRKVIPSIVTSVITWPHQRLCVRWAKLSKAKSTVSNTWPVPYDAISKVVYTQTDIDTIKNEGADPNIVFIERVEKPPEKYYSD